MIGHRSQASDDAQFKGLSASHTINGHSLVLRLVYGGFSLLFAGDLNEQAEQHLVAQHKQGKLNLRADVLKTPHHGSAEFSSEFLEAVGATVSVSRAVTNRSARNTSIHVRRWSARSGAILGRASR